VLQDPKFVSGANKVWAEVLNALQEDMTGHEAAALFLESALDVPWAFVVAALDTLRDCGASWVVIPQGARAALGGPDDFAEVPYPIRGPVLHELAVTFRPLPSPMPTPDCHNNSSSGGDTWCWIGGALLLGMLGLAIWRIRR
jgi:hypothetical protein